jgi:sugar O-acyltransferase (sialic acid O-acetyltransferase NeuD family)
MLIVGAKGFAKEVLEVLHQLNKLDNVVFFDDINNDLPKKLFNEFEILKNTDQVSNYFENIDNRFTLGIGKPILRKKLADKFIEMGGVLTSTISSSAIIGSYDVHIMAGANILSGVVFSNSVIVGKGCIIYYNSIITHDCKVGDFVEISPSVTLLGRCSIGSFSQIGSNATVLPDVKIGRNVIVGAGAVITKDVPDNCMVAGIPAKIIKELNPLVF